jgi:2-hydroxychromene-2-carboxylate isomerase
MSRSFALTWDYRCPFARYADEHVLTGLAHGADWTVEFRPFSLSQVHVNEGEPSVWDKPEQDKGILALQAGVVVRDRFPDHFAQVHRALFAARHDEGLHLEDPAVVHDVLTRSGVDAGAVLAAIDDGSVLAQIKTEHERAADDGDVWGVPTFIADGRSVFVRLMHRATAGSDAEESVRSIERVLDLLDWVDLNEFKHTTVPR